MRIALMAGLLVSGTAFSACTLGFHDDVHTRGASDSTWRDTSQYRAVDNAIHDVLVERFGAEYVRAADGPEIEYHRWEVLSDEYARGLERQRKRIQARPQLEAGGKRYVPMVVAEEQRYVQSNVDGNIGKTNERGSSPWQQMSRLNDVEVEVVNEVNALLRKWEAAGMPDPGSRHEEYLAGRSS